MDSAKIADLSHRITFQQMTLVADGQGGQSQSWGNIPSIPTVWAKINPRSARERYFSQQVQHNITHEIIVRWRDDLNTAMRISHEGRIFQIHGIRAEGEKRWFLIIDAEEGVGS